MRFMAIGVEGRDRDWGRGRGKGSRECKIPGVGGGDEQGSSARPVLQGGPVGVRAGEGSGHSRRSAARRAWRGTNQAAEEGAALPAVQPSASLAAAKVPVALPPLLLRGLGLGGVVPAGERSEARLRRERWEPAPDDARRLLSMHSMRHISETWLEASLRQWLSRSSCSSCSSSLEEAAGLLAAASCAATHAEGLARDSSMCSVAASRTAAWLAASAQAAAACVAARQSAGGGVKAAALLVLLLVLLLAAVDLAKGEPAGEEELEERRWQLPALLRWGSAERGGRGGEEEREGRRGTGW